MPQSGRNPYNAGMSDPTQTLTDVCKELEGLYGGCESDHVLFRDPLEVLVETVLSQNTTALNMRRAFHALQSAYPTWDDVMRPCGTPRAVLRPAGLARTRSRHIRAISHILQEQYGQFNLDFVHQLDTQEAETVLTRFPGVGPKTAKCVMLFAFRRDVFPIDTHILRILTRLGVLRIGTSAEAAHRWIQPHIPSGKHLSLHLNLVRHGRDVCRARRPACERCPFRVMCRYGQEHCATQS